MLVLYNEHWHVHVLLFIVHGGWSMWSAFGICDVTCGNGTMTRTRQCNNPKPLNGGEDCQGPSQTNGQCILNRCPTHGAWSAWNEWGSCSVTCGTGLRRRDRACDNPWPSMGGNPCFGDNINYEICSMPVCATWTAWGSWSSCSDTCGYGLRERYRNCSATSDMQNFCVGSDVQNVMCKTSCNENRYQLVIPQVHFYVRIAEGSSTLSPGQNIIFTNAQINEGQGYDVASGKFTVSVPGLYAFAVQYCVQPHLYGYIDIVKQGTILQRSMFERRSEAYQCVSMQAFTRAAISDQIWVKSGISSSYLYDNENMFTSFSGVLIHV
ncbi:hemicentin-1-like isoform X2 [Dreissena polymorpha]|uniref:hemicentin-1-like isoform X2 n=1 Tax=Dreissena polymorpha TaxID=45954 RepID=UPI00226449AB|nr:hemicentin-1-like isoform X2 [Dreissena polymorpha]